MPPKQSSFQSVYQQCLKHNATLVAVSKTRSIAQTLQLYNQGQRIFAENRVQELIAKAPDMPSDIEWHIIGHLQTNKVRAVIPYVRCIQSVDSSRLLQKINTEAVKADKVIRCLLQIKISREESKYGWSVEDLNAYLQSKEYLSLDHIRLEGIMGMTTLTQDTNIIRHELRQLKKLYEEIKRAYFQDNAEFNTLSMGMSGDYEIALEEGSTMVRIGSLLFS